VLQGNKSFFDKVKDVFGGGYVLNSVEVLPALED